MSTNERVESVLYMTDEDERNVACEDQALFFMLVMTHIKYKHGGDDYDGGETGGDASHEKLL